MKVAAEKHGAMTDGRGFSRRKLLGSGACCVIAGIAGCSGIRPGSSPTENGPEPTYTLTVELVEGSGDPVSEASVSVKTTQLVPQAAAQVPGRDGIVTFELENGEYVVVVESQEHTNVEESVTIEGADETMTITLERGYG